MAIKRNALASAPAKSCRAVTPGDGTPLSDGPCRALYVGTGGDVEIIPDSDSSSVTFVNVADGSILPVAAKAVLSAGTTAETIIALY